MKKFSDINITTFGKENKWVDEAKRSVTADVNPGNSMDLGVTNHYTPIDNIVTNVKNLFACRMSIVASIADDGISIKLTSSKFTTPGDVSRALTMPLDPMGLTLEQYIMSQGLNRKNIVNLGGFYTVFYSPDDVKTADPGLNVDDKTVKSPTIESMKDAIENMRRELLINSLDEDLDNLLDDVELTTSINENDDDEELEDTTKTSLLKLIDEKDKVKAAKAFSQVIAQQISLPTEYYFAGVKDKDGKESIALRWKYIKRRPHGKSAESTRSLINIYGSTDDGIWIGDFDSNAYFKIPDDVRKLIENILDLLGAEKTNDECVYSLEQKKKDDKKDDKKDNKESKSKDEDDVEDDKSRDEDEDTLSL